VGNANKIFVLPQYCDGPAITHDYRVEGALRLLTVTNLQYAEKAEGVAWLIRQLVEFCRVNDVLLEFRIAGGGQHLSDVTRFLSVIELPPNLKVFPKGFVSSLDVCYKEADVFLYHSRLDALPNVILESKRYGLPLLANDSDEFREIVSHKSNGLLYRDADSFQDYLSSLANDIHLRKTLGETAQRDHNNSYTIRAIQQQFDILMESMQELFRGS
jgi:glycosyltransferase involved in cell wall biosynthesis